MPGTPGETDPFQDNGEASEESLQSSRFKVGMTMVSGALLIVSAAAVVIALSLGLGPGSELVNRPVAIASALPAPTTPAVQATASVTATPSQSRRPSSVSGSPVPPVTTHAPEATSTPVVVALESLRCTPSAVVAGQSTTCRVTLTAPAQTDLTFEIASSDSATLTVPANVTIVAGAGSVTFEAASSSAVATTTPVTVSATMGAESRSDTVSVEAPLL